VLDRYFNNAVIETKDRQNANAKRKGKVSQTTTLLAEGKKENGLE
jgi:hypothetical protein